MAEQKVLEIICNNFCKDVLAWKWGAISFRNTESMSENIISICKKWIIIVLCFKLPLMKF